jgi:hypothetical protein
MKRLTIGLLAVGLTLASLLLALVMPRYCPVNRVAFDQIKEGTTPAEVEKILGGPPGDYRTRPVYANLRSGGGIPWTMWIGDEGEVWVWFEHGIVRGTIFQKAEVKFGGPVELIRWRLERLMEPWFSLAGQLVTQPRNRST